MKGYFSSLAKQSGVRVSGRKPGGQLSAASTEAPFSEPLHAEETVLVPPPGLERVAASKPESKPVAAEARKPNVSITEIPDKTMTEQRPEEFRETAGEKPAGIERMEMLRSEPSPEPEIVTIKQGEEKAVSAELEPAREKTSIEEVRFVEQEAVQAAGEERPPERPEIVKVEAQQPEQPRFFIKTAEMIESGDRDETDIASILFQEVREWVSAGPAEDAAVAAEPVMQERVMVEKKPRPEAEPGVVVIGQRRELEAASEPARLEEQNFSLSIGTISVVIDEGEKPAEPVKVISNERGRSTAQPEKRQYSRLSRNYL